MQKALRHTVIIDFSHYVQRKLLFWWFKSGVFEPHFGAYSRCERRYPYIKGCNSGASQKILWEQVVTCSGHSKEHFKTNLAEYWGGGGCTVGQVTSRTTVSQSVIEWGKTERWSAGPWCRPSRQCFVLRCVNWLLPLPCLCASENMFWGIQSTARGF